jgi:hypothetical protein
MTVTDRVLAVLVPSRRRRAAADQLSGPAFAEVHLPVITSVKDAVLGWQRAHPRVGNYRFEESVQLLGRLVYLLRAEATGHDPQLAAALEKLRRALPADPDPDQPEA